MFKSFSARINLFVLFTLLKPTQLASISSKLKQSNSPSVTKQKGILFVKASILNKSIWQPLGLQQKKQKPWDLVQNQTARKGDSWPQHPGCTIAPAFSLRSLHGSLPYCCSLWLLLTLHKHVACQLQWHWTEDTDFKKRNTTNPFFDKNTQMN